jgi:hypothetical protein
MFLSWLNGRLPGYQPSIMAMWLAIANQDAAKQFLEQIEG